MASITDHRRFKFTCNEEYIIRPPISPSDFPCQLNENPIQFAIRDSKITPELLQKILCCHLGLRHVTGISKAKEEVENGTQGCSLNINPSITDRSDEKTIFKARFHETVDVKVQCFLLDEKIKKFIMESIQYDMTHFKELKIPFSTGFLVKDLIKVLDVAQFCLVQYRTREQTDQDDRWFGLGRYKEQTISPQNIKYFSPLKSQCIDYQDEDLDKGIESNSEYHRVLTDVVNIIYMHFLNNIESILVPSEN